MEQLTQKNTPWAITAEAFREITRTDLTPLQLRDGRLTQFRQQGFEVIEGKAVISVHGLIAKNQSLLMQIFGGTSTALAADDFRQALADDTVKEIILDIDSPGGRVDGTAEFAKLIFESRGKKPITAFANGMMASAAYWIGSAADRVLISGPTTAVGSIGVVASHVDISKLEEKAGIKTTEITAGRFKRIASSYAPLSDDGRQTIQDEVDYLYSLFVDVVATHRGTTTDDVLNRMADGRIFIGQQALDAGLVDGITSLDAILSGAPVQTQAQASAPSQSNTARYEEMSDMETIKEQAKRDWQKDADLRAEFGDNYDTYLAYHKAEAAGGVKVCGGVVMRGRDHV